MFFACVVEVISLTGSVVSVVQVSIITYICKTLISFNETNK